MSFREARHAISQAQGLEKINLWIYNRVLEPKFDDPDAAMPRPGLSSAQAKAVADYLSGISRDQAGAVHDRSGIRKAASAVYRNIFRPIENRLPYPTRENAKVFLAVIFVVGVFLGALLLAFSLWLLAYRRRRRDSGESN